MLYGHPVEHRTFRSHEEPCRTRVRSCRGASVIIGIHADETDGTDPTKQKSLQALLSYFGDILRAVISQKLGEHTHSLQFLFKKLSHRFFQQPGDFIDAFE
jgi:hypothetical protein